ncbi:MAG: nucleotidyltransferase domain-containing protein [Leptospirales bacterium]|nr:nucleotidyltransferase domain-containing protein [Leptospirales bacterium]
MAELSKESPIARPLTAQSLAAIKEELTERLKGRVQSAWLFGSAARGDFRPESDLDLALVTETDEAFVRRCFRFEDLFDLYPRLDILVYTPTEFEALHHCGRPFWRDFEGEALRLL